MSYPFEVSPNTHHGSQTEDAPKRARFRQINPWFEKLAIFEWNDSA